MLLLLFGLSVTSYSQDFPRKDFNLEKLVDEIFPVQDLDINYEELYENLAQLLSNPADLNSITHEQLRSLMILNEDQVNSFLQYREECGPILSVYELQSIPNWTRMTFERMIPFVTVYDPQAKINSSILKRVSKEENNYLVFRTERVLEDKKGYQAGTDSAQRYAGTPEKMYLRYRVARSNDFSIGFTAEKDPGEALQWNPSQRYYGADYLSWHAQLINKGKIKNLIVGDFQTQFGQGLILGSVFGFGKNSETVTAIRRSNLGLLPYTSAGENVFFRGAGGSYAITDRLTVHGFYSNSYKDGSIVQIAEEDPTISSFTTSGLHRTPTEIRRRLQIREEGSGAVLQFKNQNIDAGVIFHQISFSEPVVRTSFPYNQFAFNGKENRNVGAFLNVNWANFTFFTEVAQTINHGTAITGGLLGNISAQLEIAMLYRKFSKDFYSFYSNALAENSTPQNEEGFYWGWKYRFSKKYSASGYVDIFQFPWLRYRSYTPSEGNEWLLRFNYTPSKTVSLFVQFREESKVRNLPDETNLYLNSIGTKRNYWFNCDYVAPPWFTFKTRIQASSFEFAGQTSRGIALVQDVNFSAGRWSFGLRYALFDTDDYDNRLYIFEKNVWLAYSFPAYYGVGVRNYVLLQYNLSKKVDLWWRWSHTRYADRDEIGTGTETIAGNSGNDVKFQVRIRF
ncbi:helix-hairpin-helix domain-containing protein [soil metagenome]